MNKKEEIVVIEVIILTFLAINSLGAGREKEGDISEPLTQALESPKGTIPELKLSTDTKLTTESSDSPITSGDIPAGERISLDENQFKASNGEFTTQSGAEIEGPITANRNGNWESENPSKITDTDTRLTQPEKAQGNKNEIIAPLKTSYAEITHKLTASNIQNLHYNRLTNTISFDQASFVHIFDRNFIFPTMGKTELRFSENSLTSLNTNLIDGSINTYDWPFSLPEDEVIEKIEKIDPQEFKPEKIITNELESPSTAADALDTARVTDLEPISNTDLEQQQTNQQDSDRDGILDLVEISNQMNRYKIDTDDDGLSDYDEFLNYPTSPIKSTTFGELDATLIDNIRSGIIASSLQSQWDSLKLTAFQDTDGDGISNWRELIYKTDPKDPDSDHDGLLDSFELTHGTTPSLPTAITSFDGKKRVIKGKGKYHWSISSLLIPPSLPIGQANEALSPTTITEEFTQDTLAFTQDQGRVREHSLVTAPIGEEQHTEETTNIQNIAHRILFNNYQHYITGGEVFIEKKDFFKFVFLFPPSLYVYDVKDNPGYYYKNIDPTKKTIEQEMFNYLIWNKRNPAESFALYRNLPGPYTIIVTKKATNDKANAVFDLRKHHATIKGQFIYRKKLFYAEPASLTTTVVIDGKKEQAEFMYTKLQSNKFVDVIESNHENNEYRITLSQDNVFLKELNLHNRISCNDDKEVSRIYNTAYTIYEQCEEKSLSSLIKKTHRPVRRYQYLKRFQSNPIVEYNSDFGDLHSTVYFKKDYFYQEGPSMYSHLPHRNLIICNECSIGKDGVAQAMKEYTQKFSCGEQNA